MRTVEVEHVSKRFRIGERRYATLRDSLSRSRDARRPELLALDDVSFTVEQGELVGIVGRNGAGKTTLLKILARITEPTSGRSRTRGRMGSLLDVGTGFHPELTGRENVFLNGAILGMRRHEIRRHFDDIVAFAGVERFLDTPIKRYSSGMHLRLAFAVAAHVDPDIIVVDEVLAVGDADFQRRCLGRMSEFAREGRTVLFVSHDLGVVARICRRGVWLESGAMRYDGPIGQAVELYLGSRGERASFVEFETSSSAPVQLVAAAITDAEGGALDTPRRDRPFALRARVAVRQPVRGLDVRAYLVSPRGVRVLDESLREIVPDADFGSTSGVWEAGVVVPPVLAAGDYILGVALSSPYQHFSDQEALSFRLWPGPEDREEAIDRSRLVQPGVAWQLEPRPWRE